MAENKNPDQLIKPGGWSGSGSKQQIQNTPEWPQGQAGTRNLFTYACNDVEFKRKDKPEAWTTVSLAGIKMFYSYPFFEFIPGTKGDEEPLRYGDFVIDIDTNELAMAAAIIIIGWFQTVYGVAPDQWRVYLSGKKGVHLELPAEILGTEAGHKLLTLAYKRLAKDIEGELNLALDTSMYNRGTGKPYRRPNVMRSTGTCKRQITHDALYEITDLEEYRAACNEPGPTWEPEDISRNNILAEKLRYYLKESGDQQEVIRQAPVLADDDLDRLVANVPPCMMVLNKLTTYAGKPAKTFNDIAIQLTAYAVTAGRSENDFLVGCKIFIEEYPSSSLNTAVKRYDNCRARFRTMAANGNHHSCGGVLALGIPGFDCNICGSKTTVMLPGPKMGTDAWPEPLSLNIHQQSDPYPVNALPETIGEAVQEVVAFVQCPVALAACSALAVASTVCQGLADVQRASKLYGPISLYLLALADSGERKTSVDGYFKKPVEEWEAEQAEAAKPDIKRYEAESQTWESEKSGILSAIKELSKKGEDTIELKKKFTVLEMAKPAPPKVPRILYSDATPEALAYQLAHGWPVVGVLSSEAGTVFGGHAMSKESAMRNMAMLNTLWGAESLTIDRRSSPSYTVRGARLTMGMAVQPETVRAFLDASKGLARGIGWLARFLIAWPESTQGNRMFKDPPEHWPHLAKFHRRLGALLDLPLPFDDNGELAPAMLELSPEAKAIWVAFHDEVEEELKPGRDMAEARDVASKAADNCARVAALFHLFENDPGGTIRAAHMQAAASVVTWHLYEARRFMGEIALPIEMNNAVKLNDWLLEYCRLNRVAEVTTREIQRTGPNCTREKRALELTLEELNDAGQVRIVKDGKRKLVKINPALLRGGSHVIA